MAQYSPKWPNIASKWPNMALIGPYPHSTHTRTHPLPTHIHPCPYPTRHHPPAPRRQTTWYTRCTARRGRPDRAVGLAPGRTDVECLETRIANGRYWPLIWLVGAPSLRISLRQGPGMARRRGIAPVHGLWPDVLI